MHLGAQIQAAIEVMEDVEQRHRPAADALADWGRSHRFAGSGDRAAIGNLVFDCLRRRRSLAARVGDEGARLAVLGVAVFHWRRPVDDIAQLCGREYGPGALSDAEVSALAQPPADDAPLPVRTDVPDWLEDAFTRAFGEEAGGQASALGERAPIDLRVNTLKADREKVLAALARHRPEPTPFAPHGIRIPPPVAAGRYPNIEAEAAHGRGWFEVQDEGSQIAALLTGAAPGHQVLDLCAGAGGKTLALAAAMENKGQIYAYDRDRNRLRRIFERLKRSSARNVQVIDAGNVERLGELAGRMDTVLVDAPCTGSGTWRRRPDAKWRLTEAALERRVAEQDEVLATAAPLVRPGGRLIYATCSLLPEENGDRVAAFLEANAAYRMVDWKEPWPGGNRPSAGDDPALTLTPLNHGTDGFYVAVMEHADAQ